MQSAQRIFPANSIASKLPQRSQAAVSVSIFTGSGCIDLLSRQFSSFTRERKPVFTVGCPKFFDPTARIIHIRCFERHD
jgi:hypothetical protein